MSFNLNSVIRLVSHFRPSGFHWSDFPSRVNWRMANVLSGANARNPCQRSNSIGRRHPPRRVAGLEKMPITKFALTFRVFGCHSHWSICYALGPCRRCHGTSLVQYLYVDALEYVSSSTIGTEICSFHQIGRAKSGAGQPVLCRAMSCCAKPAWTSFSGREPSKQVLATENWLRQIGPFASPVACTSRPRIQSDHAPTALYVMKLNESN